MSYAEFERAATSLLAVGEKPGLENIRKAIGGSPETAWPPNPQATTTMRRASD